MAMFIRKCIVNMKNVNKYSNVCVLIQSDRCRTYGNRNNKFKNRNEQGQGSWRQFHTSQVTNKTVAFKLSDIGEGIREVVVKEWFVKVGDKVQQFDNICEVQSDKAAVTITSRYDGVVTRLYHEVDQTALVGQPLVDIEVEDTENEESTPNTDIKEDNNILPVIENKEISRVKILTTPAVRRIAAQFKVNLKDVKASGRNGRVLKEDLLSHLNISSDSSNEVPDLRSVEAASLPITKAQATAQVLLDDKTVPVTGFTKAMLKTMTEAMKIPHFVFSEEYNVTKLVEAREQLKVLAEKVGVKLSYMPIIIKAASLALTDHPVLNSSLDDACQNITYKANHNIGVAMDTPNGLIVPVIKSVQNKTILEIARDLNVLQDKGIKGQLALSDLSGGTFTISNIGIIAGTYTKPIIFPPQVAIGAIGKIQVLPRFDSNGNVTKAHILTASWSADHRIIDGVSVARFSNHLKQYLENPYTLLLDL